MKRTKEEKQDLIALEKHSKRIGKTRFQNMVTGKIVTLWPSTDHPDSSYGLPVWIDKDGNSYGQCDWWEVPFGYVKV